MDSDNVSLTCCVKVEWTNKQGIVTKQFQSKTALLRLIRNEFRNIFVEVSAAKLAPVRLEIKSVSVFKNFLKEGKATIKFQEVGCTMYMTNAAPTLLTGFIRTMFVKMTGNVAKNANTSLRTQLLSSKSKSFDEISPITDVELTRAQKIVEKKSTETTPSPIRKRKLSDASNTSRQPPAKKKLYSSPSPIQSNPLDLEQKEVLEACLSGQNIFFTGSAGTGKSFLLRKIIGTLPADVTVATASTGVAACHIGGVTLHQFAGVGLGKTSIEHCLKMVEKSVASSIWRKCKHLIIDEISMIEGDYFDKIEEVARKIRRNDKPFGGIQLILCGDFLQLPPVQKNPNEKKNFCFQSKAWKKCVQRTFELKRIHRQEEDQFIKILNEVRLGNVSNESERILAATGRQNIEQDGILATQLCSHTQDADLMNEQKLKELPGELKIFEAEDSNKSLSKTLDAQMTVPSRLELKVGAQVMLLKNVNISKGLVNGARGIVKEFKNGQPVVKFRNELYAPQLERCSVKLANGAVATRVQLPLRLAWAFSIHKSQGLTLDCVEMYLGKVFEAGQAYVALSRAKSLKTLRVLNFKSSQVWANPDVLEFYQRLNLDKIDYIPLGKPLIKRKENTLKKTLKSLSKSCLNKPLMNIS